MRRLIYSSGDKYYLVNSNHFLSGLIINPLMKKKITVTQIEKKQFYKYIKQPHKKITSLQLLFILIATPLISQLLTSIDSSKVLNLSYKCVLLIVLILWIIEYIVRYLQCMYDQRAIVEISNKVNVAEIYLYKKYFLNYAALKLLRIICYTVIYFILLEGELFKILMGIFLYSFLYLIKTLQWNINVIELEDGSILTPFGS